MNINTQGVLEKINTDLSLLLSKNIKSNDKQIKGLAENYANNLLSCSYNIPQTNIKSEATILYYSKPLYKRIMFWLLYNLKISKYFYQDNWFSVIKVTSKVLVSAPIKNLDIELEIK